MDDIRVALIGDSGVGKSSIVKALLTPFDKNWLYFPTVGCNVSVMPVDGPKLVRFQDESSNEMQVRERYFVELWDIGGNARYRAARKSLFAECEGLIFVWDVEHDSTFQNLEMWLQDVLESAASTAADGDGCGGGDESHLSSDAPQSRSRLQSRDLEAGGGGGGGAGFGNALGLSQAPGSSSGGGGGGGGSAAYESGKRQGASRASAMSVSQAPSKTKTLTSPRRRGKGGAAPVLTGGMGASKYSSGKLSALSGEGQGQGQQSGAAARGGSSLRDASGAPAQYGRSPSPSLGLSASSDREGASAGRASSSSRYYLYGAGVGLGLGGQAAPGLGEEGGGPPGLGGGGGGGGGNRARGDSLLDAYGIQSPYKDKDKTQQAAAVLQRSSAGSGSGGSDALEASTLANSPSKEGRALAGGSFFSSGYAGLAQYSTAVGDAITAASAAFQALTASISGAGYAGSGSGSGEARSRSGSEDLEWQAMGTAEVGSLRPCPGSLDMDRNARRAMAAEEGTGGFAAFAADRGDGRERERERDGYAAVDHARMRSPLSLDDSPPLVRSGSLGAGGAGAERRLPYGGLPLMIVGNKIDKLPAKELAALQRTCSNHVLVTAASETLPFDSKAFEIFFNELYVRKQQQTKGGEGRGV